MAISTVPTTNAQHGRYITHFSRIHIFSGFKSHKDKYPDSAECMYPVDHSCGQEYSTWCLRILALATGTRRADPTVRFVPEHQPVQIVPVIFVQFDGSYFGACGENQVTFGNDQLAPGAVLSESFVAERTIT
uniref:Uncharacterized protein n=1 Tax=Romanomermis culicivorax TaxID=13658 RepID=A0A915I2B4_ROMCU